jgi:hypothetical protein
MGGQAVPIPALPDPLPWKTLPKAKKALSFLKAAPTPGSCFLQVSLPSPSSASGKGPGWGSACPDSVSASPCAAVCVCGACDLLINRFLPLSFPWWSGGCAGERGKEGPSWHSL